MADVQSAIRTGFYNRLLGSTNTFKTAINSRYYFHIADQGETLPYVVMDILPINQSRDSVNKFKDFIVQFNVSAPTASNCETVAGLLVDRLEDQESNLSFTGYKTIRIEQEPQVHLGKIDNVWNIVVSYRLELQEN